MATSAEEQIPPKSPEEQTSPMSSEEQTPPTTSEGQIPPTSTQQPPAGQPPRPDDPNEPNPVSEPPTKYYIFTVTFAENGLGQETQPPQHLCREFTRLNPASIWAASWWQTYRENNYSAPLPVAHQTREMPVQGFYILYNDELNLPVTARTHFRQEVQVTRVCLQIVRERTTVEENREFEELRRLDEVDRQWIWAQKERRIAEAAARELVEQGRTGSDAEDLGLQGVAPVNATADIAWPLPRAVEMLRRMRF